MSKDNLLKKLDRKEEDLVDNLVYGKNEDIFERNARRKEFEEKYGNRHISAWVPGLFAYASIKDVIKNPEYNKIEKAILCASSIASELILDAVRVGSIYGFYKFVEYLNRQLP